MPRRLAGSRAESRKSRNPSGKRRRRGRRARGRGCEHPSYSLWQGFAPTTTRPTTSSHRTGLTRLSMPYCPPAPTPSANFTRDPTPHTSLPIPQPLIRTHHAQLAAPAVEAAHPQAAGAEVLGQTPHHVQQLGKQLGVRQACGLGGGCGLGGCGWRQHAVPASTPAPRHR